MHTAWKLLILLVMVRPLFAAGPEYVREWLQWSDVTREAYVRAYVQARQSGYFEGCLANAPSSWEERKIAIEKCDQGRPTFPKKTDEYARRITQFYRTATGSAQQFPPAKLLDMLSSNADSALRATGNQIGLRTPSE